jgi:hypothetical protein
VNPLQSLIFSHKKKIGKTAFQSWYKIKENKILNQNKSKSKKINKILNQNKSKFKPDA